MRIRLIVLTAIVALGAAAAALAADGAPAKAADKAAPPAAAPAAAPVSKIATATPAADVKWSPLDPKDPKGLQVSVISGDMKSGPVEFFLKMPAGAKAPEHSHSSDYYGVVVIGNPAHGDDEKTAKTHGPGSTWFEPAKHNHYDACPGKDECLVLLSYEHGFDFIPTPAPAAPAAKK